MDLSIREKQKDGFPDDDVDLPMCDEEWDMIHQIVVVIHEIEEKNTSLTERGIG